MRSADEPVLGTRLDAGAFQCQRRQTIALLACDGFHASPARARKGTDINTLHLARNTKPLAKAAHEALVGIGIRPAQHMVHVQDEGRDAVRRGKLSREHREEPVIGALACSIGADELEQGRGVRPTRDHEQDGDTRLRLPHDLPPEPAGRSLDPARPPARIHADIRELQRD